MPEINIRVKSITGPSFDLKIVDPHTVYLPELYARVYWKIMGNKYPFVEYEDGTSDRLVTLNTQLNSDNHKYWESKRDDDGKIVYVYKPLYKYHYAGKEGVQQWISNLPPTEFADGGPNEARSYVYPTNMQNFKDLVLITQKPLEEKRINIIGLSHAKKKPRIIGALKLARQINQGIFDESKVIRHPLMQVNQLLQAQGLR